MEIVIHGKNPVLTKKKMTYILEFFGTILLGKRLANNVFLEVYNCNLQEHDMGFCIPTDWDYRNHREFEIQINRNADKESQIETLAHEMVHVKQFARNEYKMLERDIHKWKGKKMHLPLHKYKKKYRDLPWEKEAFLSEPWLVEFYNRHCDNNDVL